MDQRGTPYWTYSAKNMLNNSFRSTCQAITYSNNYLYAYITGGSFNSSSVEFGPNIMKLKHKEGTPVFIKILPWSGTDPNTLGFGLHILSSNKILVLQRYFSSGWMQPSAIGLNDDSTGSLNFFKLYDSLKSTIYYAPYSIADDTEFYMYYALTTGSYIIKGNSATGSLIMYSAF